MVEGERVLGRFTIGERIGGGGHGTVHRAWDDRLCRSVAVKAVEGDAAGRVLREAHAAARLNHPGIVTLYELGQQGGCAYLVSELVEGPNLRELAATAALSDREVAEIGAEVCAALAHAHAAGVVHRDLKPDNVLVRASSRSPRAGRFSRESGERALLADFGIARVAGAPSLTETGQVVGTLAYMSPEQAAGEQAAPASDVYSLALTLYELWSGHNPIVAATPAATARAIGEPVRSLGEVRPELPLALVESIDACLAAEPEERPSLTTLRESLLAARGALHPERPVPEPCQPASASTLPPQIPARPFAVLLAAGGLALAGALAGLPGLAIAAAALLAPAVLLLDRPREWLLPTLAALLGLLGAAPAYLAVAARRERPAGRVAFALLGWAWCGIAGAAVGRALGVPVPAAAGGWTSSGPAAIDDLLGPLLGAPAISVALIWVGAAVLLGLLLDAAGPAAAALGGLVWAAMVVACLGAAGDGAGGSLLLAPALLVAVGWAIWDRHGRPDLRPWLPALSGPTLATVARPRAGNQRTPRPREAGHPSRDRVGAPLADERARATRAARRHVRAALHGAGSRAGLP